MLSIVLSDVAGIQQETIARLFSHLSQSSKKFADGFLLNSNAQLDEFQFNWHGQLLCSRYWSNEQGIFRSLPMTAIAILNLESDPHILADTLLTFDGTDPRENATVWLPSLGRVPAQRGSAEDPWHIARLGRKTFFLPSNSGVLAYAGNGKAAFKFWADLSDEINNKSAFTDVVRVDQDFLNRVLGYTSRADEFTLLGVLIGADGAREAFIHKGRGDLVQEMKTELFGTCYVAGSGQDLVKKMINDIDIQINYSGGWNERRLTTATENLAEQVSSTMLFHETHHIPEATPESAIANRCGGFFEWYKVASKDISTYRPRIDIHLSFQHECLTVTRMYLSEQMESLRAPEFGLASQRYYLSVLNLGLEPKAIALTEDLIGGCSLHPKDCYGVCIESSFYLYDMPVGTPSQLSGPASSDCLAELFREGLKVHRVRLTVMGSERTVSRAVLANGEEDALIQIYAPDGQVEVRLSARVMATILDVSHRVVHE